jgi:hypothetical protein
MRRLRQVIAGVQPGPWLLIGLGLGLAVVAIGLGSWYVVADHGRTAVEERPRASVAGHPGASASATPTPSRGSSSGDPSDATRFGVVPASTPDAVQQALIDDGWEFLAVPAGGYSTVVPAAWVGATLPRTLDPEELDTRAFDEIAGAHDAYADVLRSATEDLRSGAIDAYGLDATPSVLAGDGGAAISLFRWDAYQGESSSALIDRIVDEHLEATAVRASIEQGALALPIGEATRLEYSFTSHRTGKPAVAVTYAISTGEVAIGLNLRVSEERAADAVAVVDTMMQALRRDLSPRRDATETLTGWRPTVLAIDASADVDDDLLLAQQRAALDFFDAVPPGNLVAMVAYADEAKVVVPLTNAGSDRNAVAAAVGRIERGGDRNLAAAISAATKALEPERVSGKSIVLLSTGPGDDVDQLVGSYPDDGPDVYAVAVGTGDQESQLHALSGVSFGRYLHAPLARDIGEAVVEAVAAAYSVQTLGLGALDGSGTAEVPLEATASLRISVSGAGAPPELVVSRPGGRRLDLETTDERVRVWVGEERTTITVLEAEPGDWRIEAGRGAASYRVDAYAVNLHALSLVMLPDEVTGTVGDPFEISMALSDPIEPDPQPSPGGSAASAPPPEWGDGLVDARFEGYAQITRPDGSTRRVALPDVGGSFGRISADHVVGLYWPGGLEPGTYIVEIEVAIAIGDRNARREARHAVYLAPGRDRDGDGLPDPLEERYGLDPTDPEDAEVDHDNDALALLGELEASTDPGQWDTDGGGESDGSEVAADRDPLAEVDDVPAVTWIPEDAQRFDPGSPDESPPAAPALEEVLPDELDGARLEIGSMRGLPRTYGFFNYWWDALLICVHAAPDDLAHAVASAAELDQHFIFAIQIEGHTGDSLVDAYAGDLENATQGRLRVETHRFGGTSYVLVSEGEEPLEALFADGPTMYRIVRMDFTDTGLWAAPGLDIDLVEALIDAIP